MDVFFNALPLTKSFQAIHTSLNDSVSSIRGIEIPDPPAIPGANKTREERQQRNVALSKKRKIDNSNNVVNASANLAVATLSIVLNNNDVLGGDQLIRNGHSADCLYGSQLYNVFSSRFFVKELIDPSLCKSLGIELSLGEDESYCDTELQILNRLFGKEGEFPGLVRALLSAQDEKLNNTRLITLHIHTERVPCGFCGQIMVNLMCSLNNRSLIEKLKEQVDLSFLKEWKDGQFLIEISSNAWDEYGIIISSCDAETNKQYCNSDKLDTIFPIVIEREKFHSYIPWHSFSLEGNAISRLMAVKRDKKNSQLKKNLHIGMTTCDLLLHGIDKSNIHLKKEAVTADIVVQGESRVVLRITKMPGDGDCGYYALDIPDANGNPRAKAVEMLRGALKGEDRGKIIELIAPEIVFHFHTLPIAMYSIEGYTELLNDIIKINLGKIKTDSRVLEIFRQKNLISQQDNIDQVLQHPEFEILKKDPEYNSDIQEFESMQEQLQNLEQRKLEFCKKEDVVRSYIENFVQPLTTEFMRTNERFLSEANYLNFVPNAFVQYKSATSVGDAIAYLLKKNLKIISPDGLVLHDFSDSSFSDTIYLIQTSSNHYDRGEFVSEK